MKLSDAEVRWVEAVFWPVSSCLKHGGEFLPDLCELDVYDALWRDRRHDKIDDLHCIREQIFVEFDIPALYARMWPEGKP